MRDACGGRAAALAPGGERGPAGLTNQESVAERLSSRSGGECCEGAVRRWVRRGAPAPDSDSPGGPGRGVHAGGGAGGRSESIRVVGVTRIFKHAISLDYVNLAFCRLTH